MAERAKKVKTLEELGLRQERERVNNLGPQIITLMQVAGDAGLWCTVHALDMALQELGWDIAEKYGSNSKRQRRLADHYKRATGRQS